MAKQRPNAKTRWDVSRLVVSKSGDLAYEYGNFTVNWDGANGNRTGIGGPYVRIWRKDQEEWKRELVFARADQETQERPAQADPAGKPAEGADDPGLHGTWILTACEVNGQKETEEQLKSHANMRSVFERNKGLVREGDEVAFETTLSIDASKQPKALDLTLVKGTGKWKDVEGKTALAIYELTGDTLRFCGTLFGAERARPTEFATKPGSDLVLFTYRREKP